MYRSLKIKLLVFFIFLVASLQFFFGIVILVFETRTSPTHGYLNILFLILALEIFFTCTVAYIAGYFYVNLSLKPAEESHARLERFTEDAAHELKTPLSVAVSHLELALRGDDVENRIGAARNEIIRLSDLIERLLEIAKLDNKAINLKTVDIAKLTKTILKKYEPTLTDKRISVQFDSSNSKGIKCDELLMGQVITNLLENAIKFNNSDRQIEIRISNKNFRITNTGEPITDKKLIFDRLYRSDQSFSKPGNGIGLYLVKRIVDVHGWDIGVKSANGINEFTIKF